MYCLWHEYQRYSNRIYGKSKIWLILTGGRGVNSKGKVDGLFLSHNRSINRQKSEGSCFQPIDQSLSYL